MNLAPRNETFCAQEATAVILISAIEGFSHSNHPRVER